MHDGLKNDLGNFIDYAWPGGYPMFYLTRDNDVLCPSCANETPEDVIGGDANWEDPHLYCDGCNERIESAYADD